MAEQERRFDDVCAWTDSCALAGAMAFFAAWRDAVVIVNGPMWCHYFALRHVEHGVSDAVQRTGCTQLDNDAIVFGAEDYLLEALQPYIAEPPRLLAIISSCAAGLIGDDVAAIARTAGISSPIVAVDSSGLAGSFAEGWQKAACAALDVLLPEKKFEKPYGVNLLGVTAGYYKGVNDAQELVRLLRLAGYEVNAVLGCGVKVSEVERLPAAALNIVVHRELGLAPAQMLSERYGTPFVAPLPPYGRAGTRRWLEEITCALPAPREKDAQEELSHVEKEDFLRLNEIKSMWGELWFDKALVRAPASMAWGLAQALRMEWADVRHLAVAADTDDALMNRTIVDEVFSETHTAGLDSFLASMNGGLLLASSNEAAQVELRQAQFLPVAYPVLDRIHLTDVPLMGLRGARFIEEQLWNSYILRKQLSLL